MSRLLQTVLLASLAAAGVPSSVAAEEAAIVVHETADGRIVAGSEVFDSWGDYANSEFFTKNGMRCGLRVRTAAETKAAPLAGALDCSSSNTNPSASYAPEVDRYRITVVVHVLQSTSGAGFLSTAQVESQIDILNEDFLAILGSNGGDGTNVEVEFVLADEDPSGNPTNGITYTTDNDWYNDIGSYWEVLAWDPSRYLNIYTNTASGNLGYVPGLPANGSLVGANHDRVVVLSESFGANGSIGPPFNHGRTTTHEVGHYLGLDHTFGNGCGDAGACYSTGDLVCDTLPQSEPTDGCSNNNSCGDPDSFDNYLDYSDDLCMERFTAEQARRIRCTLLNYRPELLTVVARDCGNCVIDPEEDCDDGNNTPGDGCDAVCIVEGNDCCAVDHGSGCSSPTIESCLCAVDSYCCDNEWDDLCVAGVDEYRCGSCGVDGTPPEISATSAEVPLLFTSNLVLAWDEAARSGAVQFNLYRATIADVLTGNYGACLYAGLSNNGAVDPAIPLPGQGFGYLITGFNGAGEGPLGYQSSGDPRLNASPCTSGLTRTGTRKDGAFRLAPAD